MNPINFNYEKKANLISKKDTALRIIVTNPLNKSTEHTFNNNFLQLEINHLLSFFQLDGKNRELEFKNLLDTNKIPYLYIGQGPFNIECWGFSPNKNKSERSDFLVNLKNSGKNLFDVKCRKKIKFHSGITEYFSISIAELEELIDLQDRIQIPVWLAFTDKNKVYNKNKTIFYGISVATIVKFHQGLGPIFETLANFKDIKVLRIPNELLTKIQSDSIDQLENQKIDHTLFNEFSTRNINHNIGVKKEIKKFISQNKNINDIANRLSKDCLSFCDREEIAFYLDELISKKKTYFKSK